jgi:NADH-quinone oxidoreductase subunit C
MTQMPLPQAIQPGVPQGDQNILLEKVVNDMQERFAAVGRTNRGQYSLQLPVSHLVEGARTLRDRHEFSMLIDITAVDYFPQMENRFHVVYQLFSLIRQCRVTLRVGVHGAEPRLPTLEGVFPGANWYEREIWDMFGIQFSGHSDLRRIMMPHDWEGHPLRKDYPLGYEEVQFTFNMDEIQKKKPRPVR